MCPSSGSGRKEVHQKYMDTAPTDRSHVCLGSFENANRMDTGLGRRIRFSFFLANRPCRAVPCRAVRCAGLAGAMEGRHRADRRFIPAFQGHIPCVLHTTTTRTEKYHMDSPTRALANTLADVDRDLEEMEAHQREHEKHLMAYDKKAKTAPGLSVGGDGVNMKDFLAHHKSKALGSDQPTYIQPGPGVLHGTVIGAKGLYAKDGTCDPFVKVSYVPPVNDGGDVKTSMLFRCKETVHTTGIVSDATDPEWEDGAFEFELDAPAAGDGVPFHIESDWSRLQGDLLFTVYDCNQGLRNERLGQVVFPLRSLVDGKSPSTVEGGPQKIHDKWYDLELASKKSPYQSKLRIQMTLILPNEVTRTVDEEDEDRGNTISSNIARVVEEDSSDDELGFGQNTRGNATEDETADEEDRFVLRENARRQSKSPQRKKKKKKIDRGAERREIERKRIAKENLIIQQRRAKSMRDRSKGPSPYGTAKGAHQMNKFNADKKTARERLQKRVEEEDKLLKERIAKVRGVPKKHRFDGMKEHEIKDYLTEKEEAAKQKQLARAKKRYQKQSELLASVEEMKTRIQRVKEETSLYKSNAQRLETAAKKNKEKLRKAREAKDTREYNMSRTTRVRTSALPEGSKSSLSNFAEARESDFAKLQREYDARNGGGKKKPTKQEVYGGTDKDEELDDLRAQLRHAWSSHDTKQRRRRELVSEARKYKAQYEDLTNQVTALDEKLQHIANRRKYQIAKAEAAATGDTRDMHNNHVDVEEAARIEHLGEINESTRETMIKIKNVHGQMEELQYKEKLRKKAAGAEINELESRIETEKHRLEKAAKKRDELRTRLEKLQNENTIPILESEVRDLRHIAAMCMVAAAAHDSGSELDGASVAQSDASSSDADDEGRRGDQEEEDATNQPEPKNVIDKLGMSHVDEEDVGLDDQRSEGEDMERASGGSSAEEDMERASGGSSEEEEDMERASGASRTGSDDDNFM